MVPIFGCCSTRLAANVQLGSSSLELSSGLHAKGSRSAESSNRTRAEFKRLSHILGVKQVVGKHIEAIVLGFIPQT